MIFFYILICMFRPQDVKLLIEDLGELKPSIFCAVPRVLDRVYTGTFDYFLISVLRYFQPLKC